ncbi:LysM peptidoglycan-binding domain-containing protein [Bizionia argentinensis JUB59]|uniref:Peptidoglycan hydrolase n=1 Tax=Bizionia argentinensis JUB59 TaxID=1046627 RepID=G2EA87_9FLAO|nr:glucosaminidase domain-containing protein [Bizionia argentinensis]EGV44720.2 LysM peptidoglycan-binding domain-containing protein [Bizionia argentinensis JUB59]
MKRIVVLICMALIVFSCGSKKRAASKSSKKRHKTERVVKRQPVKLATINKPNNEPVKPPVVASSSPIDDYIALYSDIAQDEMRLYHIPASITLAQGILESSSGRGRLSVEANNHFGIKCHEWTGARIYHDDDSDQECFRKYNDAKYSYRDHSLFLKERKRYYKLFELEIDDYKGWARGLKDAGYATDRKYPDKLISLIERYNLHQYDDIVTGNKRVVNVDTNQATGLSHRVLKGDTLYSLSKRYNTSVDDLKKINNLSSNSLNIGDLLVVKLK